MCKGLWLIFLRFALAMPLWHVKARLPDNHRSNRIINSLGCEPLLWHLLTTALLLLTCMVQPLKQFQIPLMMFLWLPSAVTLASSSFPMWLQQDRLLLSLLGRVRITEIVRVARLNCLCLPARIILPDMGTLLACPLVHGQPKVPTKTGQATIGMPIYSK